MPLWRDMEKEQVMEEIQESLVTIIYIGIIGVALICTLLFAILVQGA